MKKNRLSTFFGTLAGYCLLAKLRNFKVKFVAAEVSFSGGSVAPKSGSFDVLLIEDGDMYSRIPVVVELSKVPWPVTYGLAAMTNEAFG